MNRKHRVGLAAAVIATAAAGVSGYAAAGSAGLIDAASAVAVAVLIVARGTVRGEKPPFVWPKKLRPGRPSGVSTAEFPGYEKIFSDLSWAQVAWRHYQHPLRPMLARLAAALDRREAVAADLAASRDPDAPGPDLAILDRIITNLEGPRP